MKTILKRSLLVLSALVLMFSLVSCGDTSKSIKKEFENNEYNVLSYTGGEDEVKAVLYLLGLTDEQKAEIAEYEVILVNKQKSETTGGFLDNLVEDLGSAIPDAIIVKFPSAGDLKDFMTVEKSDGTKDTSAYDKASDAGLINGNCWLAYGNAAAKEIFK